MTDVAVTETLGEALSPSQVNTHMTCPAKWYFRYLIGLSEPTTGALALGKAFHGTLAWYFRQKLSTGRDMKAEELREVFVERFGRAQNSRKQQPHKQTRGPMNKNRMMRPTVPGRAGNKPSSAVSQFPTRTPSSRTPFTRRMPAARSGLSSPQSDASYASRRIAAEVLMGRCLEAKGAQFVQRLLPAKNASVHASGTSCHM